MTIEREHARNEWVAQQLGIPAIGVYRDDNCFIQNDDESGQTTAYMFGQEGVEYLAYIKFPEGERVDAIVPEEHRLGLA